MAGQRPITGEAMLLAKSAEIWCALSPADWSEAFRSHPRIGESEAHQAPEQVSAANRSRRWSAAEQRQALSAAAPVKAALAKGNREYERRFGRTFIICAMGKSPAQMLEILARRLKNDPGAELREAAREQRQITEIRLQRWLRQ
jgi:2-oxo-4-hydroxy-4-carboxy-5-ureidoimidazoline decarboxylase